MTKLKQVDWQELDERLRGKTLEEAVRIAFKELVDKLNEVVDVLDN